MTKIKFSSAPLPFQGQKRRYVKRFASKIDEVPREVPVYDLFGGSGLLANTCLELGFTDVTWNDYDNFEARLDLIPETNEILAHLRTDVLSKYPRKSKLDKEGKRAAIDVLDIYDSLGPVDFLTISSSLLFSMNYCKSLEEFEKATMYANYKDKPYERGSYLEGVRRTSEDFRPLMAEGLEREAFLILDPPYLSTDIQHYAKEEYWNFIDYLNLVYAFKDSAGFAYFTSDKSQVVELLEWYEIKQGVRSPFTGSDLVEIETRMAGNIATYSDQMFYKYRDSLI